MLEQKFSQFLIELAQESFEKEKVLYKDLKDIGNIKKVDDLYDHFSNNYKIIQTALINKIFGDNYSFLFSFCNNDFLHKIINTGGESIKKSITNLKDIAENVRSGLKDDNDNNLFFGLYNIATLDAEQRKKDIKNISFYVTKTIFDSLVDASIIETQKVETEKIEKKLKTYIENSFENFSYRYTKKGGREKVIVDKEGKKEVQTISLYGSQNGLVLKKNGDFGKILFDQSELIKIITNALKNLKQEVSNSKLKDKVSINITTAKNEILINFELDSNNKNNTSNQINPEAISKSFYNVVYNALPNEQQDDFKKFWDNNGKTKFEQLGDSKFKKILSASTEALTSGELGETMVTIFLSTLPLEQQESVKVFGQTRGTTGEAAVDIGLKYASKEIGFQVKNYTSSVKDMVLYTQSNDLMAEDIARYITDTSLKAFRNNIRESIYYNGIGDIKPEKEDERINNNLVILQKHIQYYLRYDEAQGKSTEIQNYKNNFYILNFRIIPSSILFLLLANIVKKEENKEFIGEQIFFVTTKKQSPERGQLLDKQSFKTTYANITKNKNIFSESINSNSNTKNPCDNLTIPKNKIYINFTGIKIRFKDELKILL